MRETLPLDDPVARVDGRRLADQDVLGLGLRDADDRLELVRHGHAGQVGADGDALALLDRDQLEHARDAGR